MSAEQGQGHPEASIQGSDVANFLIGQTGAEQLVRSPEIMTTAEIKAQIQALSESREIDPNVVHEFMGHRPGFTKTEAAAVLTTTIGAGVGILLGTIFAASPEIRDAIHIPLPPRVLHMFSFWHNTHNGPTTENNLIAHLPDLGFDTAFVSPLLGFASRIASIRGWRKELPALQEAVGDLLETGGAENSPQSGFKYKMRPGFTALLVGSGDPLADEFVRTNNPDEALLFSNTKPKESPFWVHTPEGADRSKLARSFEIGDFENCGEIMIMPVQAEHMVFTPQGATDISPAELELMIKNIRSIEKTKGDEPRPVIIVGDKKQSSTSYVYVDGQLQEDQERKITLESIATTYDGVEVIDPTDLILDKVMRMANGRKIALRATRESIEMYGKVLDQRIQDAKYVTTSDEVFYLGYNIYDAPTIVEKDTSAYIVLSASARDKLLEEGVNSGAILFAPGIVLEEMNNRAERQ